MNILEYFTTCWWWQLFWMFLSFLLGWCLAKCFGKKSDDCCDELVLYKRKYNDLELKYRNFTPSANIQDINTVIPSGYDPYAKLSSDNLQIIEGIGPKMEELLHKNKVKNWVALAGKTPDALRTLLDKEDASKYKIIDPSTWSDQAQLAVDGKWEELIAMQKTLDTGKTDAITETDSKLEKILIKLGYLKKWTLDDLKAVEGIGPKIEELFHNAGIKTWEELADTSVDRLKEILQAAGDRYKLADPGTWPKQARLAAEGKWNELMAYQEQLNGGR